MEGGTTQENQWFFSRHWKCTVSVPCIYQRHTDDKNFYWKTLAAIILNESDVKFEYNYIVSDCLVHPFIA